MWGCGIYLQLPLNSIAIGDMLDNIITKEYSPQHDLSVLIRDNIVCICRRCPLSKHGAQTKDHIPSAAGPFLSLIRRCFLRSHVVVSKRTQATAGINGWVKLSTTPYLPILTLPLLKSIVS